MEENIDGRDIVPLDRSHVPDMVKIHIEAFPNDFLPSLGGNFLSTLYSEILDRNLGFGYGYLNNGQLIGFVFASDDTGHMFKQVIKKKWFKLGMSAMKKAFDDSSIISNMFRTLFYQSNDETSSEIKSELLVIGVLPGQHGQGIGKKLVKSLNAGFSKRGIMNYKVAVYKDNLNANEFYKSAGFKHLSTTTLYDKACNIYSQTINEVL